MKLQCLLAVCECVLSLSKDGSCRKVLRPLIFTFTWQISSQYFSSLLGTVYSTCVQTIMAQFLSPCSLTQIIALNSDSYFLLTDHKLFIPCLLFFFTQNDIPANRGVYLFHDFGADFFWFFYQVLGARKSQFLLESHSWVFSSAALINLECWDNLSFESVSKKCFLFLLWSTIFPKPFRWCSGVHGTSLLPAAAPSFLPR